MAQSSKRAWQKSAVLPMSPLPGRNNNSISRAFSAIGEEMLSPRASFKRQDCRPPTRMAFSILSCSIATAGQNAQALLYQRQPCLVENNQAHRINWRLLVKV